MSQGKALDWSQIGAKRNRGKRRRGGKWKICPRRGIGPKREAELHLSVNPGKYRRRPLVR
jgi:hypothetical protein